MGRYLRTHQRQHKCMEPDLSEDQKLALDDQLKRAGAFEELIRTKGWEYIKAYFTNKVQSFANSLLLQPQEPIEKFEAERQELAGLRKLIGYIDSDLQVLKDFRKKHEAERQEEEKNT